MEQIELKRFVKEALLGVTEGIEEANSERNRFRIIGEKRNESKVDGDLVEFDVSLVVGQQSSGKVGGEVGVPVLKVVSVNANVNQIDSHQNVNRLKFRVWVSENELG